MSRRRIDENHRAAKATAAGRWDSGFLADAAFETLSNRQQGAAAAAFVPKERVCADKTRRAGSGPTPPRRGLRTFLRARRSRAALAMPVAGATASALAQVSIASTPANVALRQRRIVRPRERTAFSQASRVTERDDSQTRNRPGRAEFVLDAPGAGGRTRTGKAEAEGF